MKTFSAEAVAAIASGDVLTSAAAWFGGAEATGFWGGFGNLVVDGRAYVGVGDRAFVQVSAGAVGANAQGGTLSLSGVDPDIAGALSLAALRGVPVIIYRLIFNGSGVRLLHAAVFLRGRVDRAPIVETPGGTSTISIGIEGAARGLGRRSERTRSHHDQQMILAGDTGLRRIAYAGDKEIIWGGKPPERAGGAMGGSYAGVGGGGGIDSYVNGMSV